MVGNIILKLKRIAKLDIVKIFSFTSISTLIKMIAGFISIKVVAVIIGPDGIALVGQLNNFCTIIMGIATGGITTGVTKYIAQYSNDEILIKSYIGTATKMIIFFSFVCSILLILLSSFLSNKILLNRKYFFVFIVFGVALIFYAFNAFLLAIINGYKQFKLYVKVSIVSSIISLVISLLLVIPFGIIGALLNTVTAHSFIFIVLFFFCKKIKVPYLNKDYFFHSFDRNKVKKYLSFSLMTLVSSFCVPVSQLVIRSYIINKFSIQIAGWWEGIIRLSGAYLMIITSSFSVYYLPKLSELKNINEIRNEIKIAYKVIVPCLVIGFLLIYFCRFIIINLLYSSEFLEMSKYFLLQLFGDFFKITSWILALVMHAKAIVKTYITTEIIFSVTYMFLAITGSNLIGIQGFFLGYAINYLIYFIFMYIFIYRKMNTLGFYYEQ
jgi:PST family polysaccharide transporter